MPATSLDLVSSGCLKDGIFLICISDGMNGFSHAIDSEVGETMCHVLPSGHDHSHSQAGVAESASEKASS